MAYKQFSRPCTYGLPEKTHANIQVSLLPHGDQSGSNFLLPEYTFIKPQGDQIKQLPPPVTTNSLYSPTTNTRSKTDVNHGLYISPTQVSDTFELHYVTL
jgi:hypothetical protein